MSAAEQLDQQRAADVERLVHVSVHFGVQVHRFTRRIAQGSAEFLCGHDKQRKDDYAEDGQAPFQRKHDPQDGDCLHNVRDDADDRVTDGGLSPDHVVVQPAHEFAHLGVGEESQ